MEKMAWLGKIIATQRSLKQRALASAANLGGAAKVGNDELDASIMDYRASLAAVPYGAIVRAYRESVIHRAKEHASS